MTDLEITRLCAAAMDIPVGLVENVLGKLTFHSHGGVYLQYDPLHDDAQAMALVKRFGLVLDTMANRELGWCVCLPCGDEDGRVISTDLNRAIVGCVAKMRVDRTAQETSTVARQNEQKGVADQGSVRNATDELRLSKRGYSLRVGGGDEKRIVAVCPGSSTTQHPDEKVFKQWLEDSDRLIAGWNAIRALPDQKD